MKLVCPQVYRAREAVCAVLPVRTSATHTASCRTSIAALAVVSRPHAPLDGVVSYRRAAIAALGNGGGAQHLAGERVRNRPHSGHLERAVLLEKQRGQSSRVRHRETPSAQNPRSDSRAPPDSPGGSNHHLLCPRKVRREPPGNAGVALCWVCEPVLVSGRHERRWTAYVTTDVFMPL